MGNNQFKELERIGLKIDINHPLEVDALNKKRAWAMHLQNKYSPIYKIYAFALLCTVIAVFFAIRYSFMVLSVLMVLLVASQIYKSMKCINYNFVARLLVELDVERDHEAIINLKNWASSNSDISEYVNALIAMGRKPTVAEYLYIRKLLMAREWTSIAKKRNYPSTASEE